MKYISLIILTLLQYGLASNNLNLGKNVTVSGISSGGYFAHQFHIINSGLVNGAAIFAAGPFYCARGNAITAMKTCMEGKLVSGTSLFSYQYINTLQFSGLIDPTFNLKDDKVFLFSGVLDKVVHQEVTNELNSLYELLGVKELKYVKDLQVAHTLPTLDQGGECTKSQTPFIGNCNYNGALESLRTLYPDRRKENNVLGGTLTKVSQRKYFSSFDIGLYRPLLMEDAYMYIPKYCKDHQCELHIAFHGCKQSLDDIGTDYIDKSGFIEASEELGLVVLFPQAKKSLSDFQNPNSCWDWWGYSGMDYSVRTGQQVRIITDMVKDLLNKNMQ
ncbi:hypothetical protein [Halobacteriovorax sp. YZS-1-1]|uniref:extracellular catalytic domain type 2 short-chain-length polyhydroxyalkanoate depolymerase n=1 Tax=unclassified Halobacteriovorax TaxID=2639665 RepID=UPI00399BD432